MQYNFKEIEDKWQDYWAKNETFKELEGIHHRGDYRPLCRPIVD